MRLIFVRHAEPDYAKHTLTEKGFREAQCIRDRIIGWDKDVACYYASPLERAILTAKPALDELGKEPVICSWLQEFAYMITDPTTGRYPQVPWDFMPQYWTVQEQFYDRKNWFEHEIFRTAPEYEKAVYALREGLDGILAQHGYVRSGDYYLADPAVTSGDDDKTLVFFAHLGANLEAVGYLLGIAPIILQQTFYTAPTSVTVLNAEKRTPGIAMFRAQMVGDTSHLKEHSEPVSLYGAFSSILQEV